MFFENSVIYNKCDHNILFEKLINISQNALTCICRITKLCIVSENYVSFNLEIKYVSYNKNYMSFELFQHKCMSFNMRRHVYTCVIFIG